MKFEADSLQNHVSLRHWDPMCCLLLKVSNGCAFSELMGREKASWKMANGIAAEPILFLCAWIFCSFPKSDLLRLIEQAASLPLAHNGLRTVQVVWFEKKKKQQWRIGPLGYRNVLCSLLTLHKSEISESCTHVFTYTSRTSSYQLVFPISWDFTVLAQD